MVLARVPVLVLVLLSLLVLLSVPMLVLRAAGWMVSSSAWSPLPPQRDRARAPRVAGLARWTAAAVRLGGDAALRWSGSVWVRVCVCGCAAQAEAEHTHT